MPFLTPFAKRLLLPAALLAIAPATLRAQALADRVPADSILYVGWKGADALAGAYGESNLKTVVSASGLPETMKTVVPQLIDKVAAEDPKSAEGLRLAYDVAAASWRYPTAFALERVDFTGGEPVPMATVLIDAGPDAPAVKKRIDELLAKAKAENPGTVDSQVRSFVMGGTVGLTVGHPAGDMAMAGKGQNRPAPLADADDFKAAMAQSMKDPAVAVYLNHDKLLNLIDFVIDEGAPPQAAATWARFRGVAGLTGLHHVLWTAGFDGKDWRARAFLAAPAPRAGLLALFEGGPFDESLLKDVPADATRVQGAQVDLQKSLSTVAGIVRQTDADAGRQFDGFLGQLDQIYGGSVQRELLAPLGKSWVVYTSPTVGGNGLLGLVAVNKLADPAKAAVGIGKFATAANNALAGSLRDQPYRVAGRSAPAGDGETTIYYLGTPLITPAFAVKGDRLYLSFYPQNIQSALAAVGEGKSITDSPKFAAVRKRLGETPTVGFGYDDTPELADNGYPALLGYSRLAVGLADIFRVIGGGSPGGPGNRGGVKADVPATDVPLLFPPLRAVLAALAPEGSVAWADDAGVHFDVVSSFPGSAAFTNDPVASSISNQAVMVSILLPSLNRARETANRIKSASNLRQIGQGLLLYSNENNNTYPADLATLLRTEDMTPAVLDSPLGDAPGGDYVYLFHPGLDNTAPADVILAYDAAAWREGQGTNVLYGDGHVSWEQPDGFAQSVALSRRSDPKSCPPEKMPADLPPSMPAEFGQ